MAQTVLAARVRESKGKGAARRLRKKKQIPAIFYGPKTEPVMLAVGYADLKSVIKQGSGENIIFDLQVQSDKGTESRKAMLKELLTDPVDDTFLHADFYEISMDKEVTVGIPIHLLNTPIGVTNGGILQHIRRELMISCLPDKLIDSLDIDISGLEVGDSLHVRDIVLPDGMRSTEDAHVTVAIIAAPTVMPEEEEVEVEEEEGLVEESAESKEPGTEES